MAGIGFELKKLFKDEGVLSSIRAYLFSIFVTIGPVVITVLVITFLQLLLRSIGVAVYERELLQATILYSFVFSVIVASGYCMMLSRYLADKFYYDNKKDILPALFGSISLIAIIAGIVGIIFYWRSPLDLSYKFLAYMLFIELTVEIVLSVFTTALKNYKKIAYSFVSGTVLGILTSYLIIEFTALSYPIAVLIGFDLGFLVIITMLIREIKMYFSTEEKSDKYYSFVAYLGEFKLIFFTNLFFVLGLYIHNFVFWGNPETSKLVAGTYLYAPIYDMPSFYAFLSILPTLVIFVVKVETDIFDKYRNYVYMINQGACYEDIELAKKEMKKVFYKELLYMMSIQLFFSLLVIVMGIKFLPYIGFTQNMIDTFSILVLGYYCVVVMYIVITLFLYYDIKERAAFLAFTFLVTNFIFTLATTLGGGEFYGLGFFLSGLVCLVFSAFSVLNLFDELDYYVFCMHVSWAKREETSLDRMVERFNRIGG